MDRKVDVCIVPMAGKGSRFFEAGYSVPKPLIEVGGKPMFVRAMESMPPAEKWVFIALEEHLLDGIIERETKKAGKGMDGAELLMVPVQRLTSGGAETCLLASEHVEAGSSVFVSACDISPRWNRDEFWGLIEKENPNCIVFGFRNHKRAIETPGQFSWIRESGKESGRVKEISLKTPVSGKPENDLAIAGSFYFRNFGDFEKCTISVVEKMKQEGKETHLEAVINEMLERKLKVLSFEVDEFVCFGTPEELGEYLKGNKKNRIRAEGKE